MKAEDVENMIKSADVDTDGKLDQTEFVRIFIRGK